MSDYDFYTVKCHSYFSSHRTLQEAQDKQREWRDTISIHPKNVEIYGEKFGTQLFVHRIGDT